MRINPANYSFASLYIKSAPPANKRVRPENSKETYNYKESLKLFRKKIQEIPHYAFLYDPELSVFDKKLEAKQTENLYSLSDYQEKTGISASMLKAWGEAGHYDVMKLDKTFDAQFIVSDCEFLNKVNEKFPDCVTVADLMKDCNITSTAARKLIKDNQLFVLELNEIKKTDNVADFLIDTTNPVNAKTILDYKKLSPKPSEKYYKSYERKKDMVPIRYLSELGFGPVPKLRELVKYGYLPGVVKKFETEDGVKFATYVDVADEESNTEGKLIALRKSNENIMDSAMFLKFLRISEKRLNQAIINDEVVIIPEYIFLHDFNKAFIDITNPVNQEFLNQHKKHKH